jgi:hypothetical protein
MEKIERLKFCGTVFEQKRKCSGAVPPEKNHDPTSGGAA